VEWLLRQRQPGRWAVLPSIDGKYPEPLLAFYDFRTRLLLEDMAHRGLRAPRFLVEHPQVVSPCPPAELHACWKNVNTPEEYSRALTAH
jgi:molybdopterin-guanine dinucleotide biosynthesis protein A